MLLVPVARAPAVVVPRRVVPAEPCERLRGGGGADVRLEDRRLDLAPGVDPALDAHLYFYELV